MTVLDRDVVEKSLTGVTSTCEQCGCGTVSLYPMTGGAYLICTVCGKTTYHGINFEFLRNCLLTNEKDSL